MKNGYRVRHLSFIRTNRIGMVGNINIHYVTYSYEFARSENFRFRNVRCRKINTLQNSYMTFHEITLVKSIYCPVLLTLLHHYDTYICFMSRYLPNYRNCDFKMFEVGKSISCNKNNHQCMRPKYSLLRHPFMNEKGQLFCFKDVVLCIFYAPFGRHNQLQIVYIYILLINVFLESHGSKEYREC